MTTFADTIALIRPFNSTILRCHVACHWTAKTYIRAMILIATTTAIGCTVSEPDPVVALEEPVVAADMILYNGKIVTVNQEFDIESALAIHGKNILAVGKDEAIRALASTDTRMIDLQGKTVIPGLIDGHTHLVHNAVNFHLGVDVVLVESIEEMVMRIGEKVAQSPPGELIYTTSGWLPQQFKENRTPTRHDLDPVSPNNPVIVQGGHSIIFEHLCFATGRYHQGHRLT